MAVISFGQRLPNESIWNGWTNVHNDSFGASKLKSVLWICIFSKYLSRPKSTGISSAGTRYASVAQWPRMFGFKIILLKYVGNFIQNEIRTFDAHKKHHANAYQILFNGIYVILLSLCQGVRKRWNKKWNRSSRKLQYKKLNTFNFSLDFFFFASLISFY